MNVFSFAETILLDGSLESKFIDPNQINWDNFPKRKSKRIFYPRRLNEIAFSEEQIKFPKKSAMKNNKQRGKALHFFANHELLAIEMMAAAIILFPNEKRSFYKTLVDTISEEQFHFKLYRKRMDELGVRFGEYPLNKFFWSFMEKIKDIKTFFSVVSLTFEQANLDFALYYRDLFSELGDEETSSIMNTIYNDEIKHVARGRVQVASSLLKESQTLSFWEYYLNILPSPITADRAKGIIFDERGRERAGLDREYISNLKEFQSNFNVTKRKQWK